MRAIAVVNGRLKFKSHHPAAVLRDGEVRVRPIQAGICETDLQLVTGYMNFSGVLGHEFVGFAESGKFAGKRVVGEINCICNDCAYCKSGLGNHCPNRTVIGILNHDGAFADSLAVPERNLYPVPNRMSNDQATLVEPVAAALQVIEQVTVGQGSKVIVLGDGRLGNLCAQALQHHGCNVLVVGKHRHKLDRLKKLEINTALLEDGPTQRTADVVVECTGSPTGLAKAFSLVRPRGTIVMKTTVSSLHEISLAPVVIDEISLVGSRCGPFGKAIAAIQRGQFALEEFVCGRYPLEAFEQAFEHARAPDALKVVFEIS